MKHYNYNYNYMFDFGGVAIVIISAATVCRFYLQYYTTLHCALFVHTCLPYTLSEEQKQQIVAATLLEEPLGIYFVNMFVRDIVAVVVMLGIFASSSV
eukprot:6459978-Amphidinium_carterae.1